MNAVFEYILFKTLFTWGIWCTILSWEDTYVVLMALVMFWLFATPWTMALSLLCPWNSPGRNTGVDCHFLLQRIFLTQGSNLSLLHCRQILYHLSHQGMIHFATRERKNLLRFFINMTKILHWLTSSNQF